MIQLTDKSELITPRSNTRKMVLPIILMALISINYFTQTIPSVSSIVLFPLISINQLLTPVTPILEVFEIQPDVTVPIGSTNFTTTILNTTTSTVEQYYTPDFNATGGLLTLNVTNNDLIDSDPILGEILVDSIPIWRFSSPSGKLNTITKSSTTKNITEFLSVFQRNSTIEFNILEGKADLTTELALTLYNDGSIVNNNIFETNGPANVIYPITQSIPNLSTNITAAKLSIFASPAKEEILYYKSDIAIGSTTSGPLRYLNVFINDIYLTTITPKPTLFHSHQIADNASSLWTPLSDTGSFSGLAYEVDLVSVLPLLYSGAKIDIQVVSPVNAPTGPVPSLPAPIVKGPSLPNWDIKGSLLGWESNVLSSVSEFGIGESSQLNSGVLIAPPATSPFQPSIKNQIVKSSLNAGLISQLNVTLPSGNFNYTILTNTSTHAFLTKQSKQIKKISGPPGTGLGSTTTTSSVTLITGSKNNVAIVDDFGLTYLTKNTTFDFPFTFDETATESNTMFGTTSGNSVKSEINSDIKWEINAIKQSYKVKEKLELDDIKGSKTDIKVEIKGDLPFKREVEADNGVIVKDTITLSLV